MQEYIVTKDQQEKAIKDLRDVMRYSIDKFDTQCLTISSGTLVLSVSFIGNIVPLLNSIYVWILMLAWILLCTAIISSIGAHLISFYQSNKIINRIKNSKPFTINNVVNNLNILVATSMSLGIILMLTFVIINLTNMPTKNSTNQSSTESLKNIEGAMPPQFGFNPSVQTGDSTPTKPSENTPSKPKK